MDKKVSVVTCTYNSAKTVRHTFESVLAQVDDIYEYIVVDGASTDETVEIIKEYDNEIIINELDKIFK